MEIDGFVFRSSKGQNGIENSRREDLISLIVRVEGALEFHFGNVTSVVLIPHQLKVISSSEICIV